MVNLASMMRDPQARYFNDEEYEPDPDQLPLAKTMRRFGFVIFICGTIEVSDVICGCWWMAYLF